MSETTTATQPAGDAPAAPQSLWARVLTFTPVVMTVVATLLASLSSGEMTKAQYFRALAAQNQSKAGDQWAFFQAKRLRSAGIRNTLDILQSTSDLARFEPATLATAAARLPAELARLDAQARRAMEALAPAGAGEPEPVRDVLGQYLQGAKARLAKAGQVRREVDAVVGAADFANHYGQLRGELALGINPLTITDAKTNAALAAIDAGKPESEVTPLVAAINPAALDEAFVAAARQAAAGDAAVKPVTDMSDRLDQALSGYAVVTHEAQATAQRLLPAVEEPETAATPPAAGEAARSFAASSARLHEEALAFRRDFTAAKLNYAARRYDAESRANQAVGNLYELTVRSSSAESDHHRVRSERFFWGMLFAQAAVVISSLALAVRQRNVLWGLAAVAGLAAASFGAYVFLYV